MSGVNERQVVPSRASLSTIAPAPRNYELVTPTPAPTAQVQSLQQIRSSSIRRPPVIPVVALRVAAWHGGEQQTFSAIRACLREIDHTRA